MGLLDFLKKTNEKLSGVNDMVNSVNNALGLSNEESNDKKDTTKTVSGVLPPPNVEKPVPSPRLFDKNGREIRPNSYVRR